MSLKTAVHKAFGTLRQNDYASKLAMPPKARATLRASVANRPGDDWNRATFATKTIAGQRVWAALVPGVDWLDVTVVNRTGNVIAAGTFDAGAPRATWS